MKTNSAVQKYPAKKGNYLLFIILSLFLPVIYIWLLSFQFKELIPYSMISFVPFLFLLWIYCTTTYHIINDQIFYRSAFVRGSFYIKDIEKIEWVNRPKEGIRPALASKGMVIYFGEGKRVFLAPLNPKGFIKRILHTSPQIKVERKIIYSKY